MQQQQAINPELEALKRQERSVALNQLAKSLQRARRSVTRILWIALGVAAVFALLLFVLIATLNATMFALMALFMVSVSLVLASVVSRPALSGIRRRRSPRWVRKFRQNLQMTFGERYQSLAALAEPLLAEGIHGTDLPAVLQLGRTLFRMDWWMGDSITSANVACLTTLHRLLGQAPVSALTALSTEDRAYLLQVLHKFVTSPTGWYLDTELPIRLFLILGEVRQSGAEAVARHTVAKTKDERLQEAAREYLAALRV